MILDGRDVTAMDPAQRDIAMVFQNYALYPHMSVFDNIAFGVGGVCALVMTLYGAAAIGRPRRLLVAT